MICCIFGGADISDYSALKLPADRYVIAADGGFRHCSSMGITPDVLLGDFDSIGEFPCGSSGKTEVIRAPAEKDDTDTMLAVKLGIERGFADFRLYGVIGGRMGHTLAAVQTLGYIRSCGCEGEICSELCDISVMTEERRIFSSGSYRYVSLISLAEETIVSVTGLKYSGDNIRLTWDFPLGVSNEFAGESCIINVKKGKIAVIFEKM